MSSAARWSLVVVTVLLVVGVVAFARGPQHHRGDETAGIPALVAVPSQDVEDPGDG